jgi:dTDP-4-dehydrorhamnose reductase
MDTMTKINVIIFGSTGMLGKYVSKTLNGQHNVTRVDRSQYDILKNSWEQLEEFITKVVNPCHVIVNCVGAIPQKYDKKNYYDYIKVNTLFPHKLNEISKKINCKLIHITTDCVFDGQCGNYSENDIHTEKGIYGVSKSLGEPNDSTIIRTSIIGEDTYNHSSLLEWLIQNKNKDINGFVDHYWNGVTCLTLSKIINEIITRDLYWNGVRHIFSPEIVSKYELSQMVNDIYQLNINIQPFHKGYTNRSLTSVYTQLFKIEPIYTQILGQKDYLFELFENKSEINSRV